MSEIVRAHSDEILAIGQTLASNGSLSVSSATAELRVAIQNQRNQVKQLRVFLESIHTVEGLPLPKGSKITVGIHTEDSKDYGMRNLDDILKTVYETAREVNDATLSDALSKMFLPHREGMSPTAEPANRQFARRVGDRERVGDVVT